MSASDAFSAAAAEMIKSRGASATYSRASEPDQTLNVLIDHEVEIIDPSSGAPSYVTAAIFAKSEFGFAKPKPSDSISQNSRTWVVKRQLEDDGHLITVEVI